MSYIDKNWRDKYRKKIISGEEASKKIKSGMGVEMMGIGSECLLITQPLIRREDIEGVRIYFTFMRPDSSFAHPEKLVDRFKLYSHFLSNVSRPLVEKGLMDYIPSHNSSANRQFIDGHIRIDAAILNLTPPDKNGFLSMSYRPGMHKPMVHQLKREKGNNFLVITSINEHLPVCCGDTLIHESEIDFMLEDHSPMVPVTWYSEEELGEEMPKIAQNVATLIEDGATLEFGIGKIPPHVCRALTNKNDLGIHTEILSGPIFDLIKAGVVTGKYKTLHPYQVVFGFAYPNSMEMYEWFDRNPVCNAYPLNYVCDTSIIAQNYKFIAINSAVQVDLTGQNNSEVISNIQWSGTGGQLDYMKAACLSKGGKAIIAMKSTAKGGTISRITGGPFYPGGGTTLRNDTQYVVTEYGIAKLEGSSLRERAHALIEIAHPKFRDELIVQAKERHLW
jgi:4-hydroxybutyrate CoA-transferase